LSRVAVLPLVVLLLLMPGGAQAADDALISSASGFQPGEPVLFNITGTPTISFNIRITDSAQNIVGGRDAALNGFGTYIYTWTPGQDGEYNVTVTYATGISLTKQFLIQKKVTTQDIAEIYLAIYRIQQSLDALIKDLDGKINIALVLGGISVVFSLGVVLWAKKNISKADSEFEQWMKSHVEAVLMKEVAKLRKEIEKR
jgi:hypothetical protein